MVADYEEDPRTFLEQWIRDSAANYNDGERDRHAAAPGGRSSSESQLRALITFLLDQTGE